MKKRKYSRRNKMNRKIVRVSQTEFETADGNIHPMMFELDKVPTVEEFQKSYDEWLQVFHEKGLLEEHES